MPAPAAPECVLAVKAVPNAPRSQIAGWLAEALKVKLHAPPVDGKANAELCRFLAETLGLPRHAVTLVAGDTARHKRVRIVGLSLPELRSRLGP